MTSGLANDRGQSFATLTVWITDHGLGFAAAVVATFQSIREDLHDLRGAFLALWAGCPQQGVHGRELNAAIRVVQRALEERCP